MESNINNALILLAIGMITVFVILALVVFAGNLLIKIVNRYAPQNAETNRYADRNQVAPSIIAAITAVVDTVTVGQGKIEKIERVE